jgi:hypothetical protein
MQDYETPKRFRVDDEVGGGFANRKRVIDRNLMCIRHPRAEQERSDVAETLASSFVHEA